MLQLRQEQVEAFQAVADKRLEARLRAVVQKHWPELAGRLGDEGIAALIRSSIAACRGRGIDDETSIGRYLNVACALGNEFEDDPRYPWARATLDDTRLRPEARIAKLVALTKKVLEETT